MLPPLLLFLAAAAFLAVLSFLSLRLGSCWDAEMRCEVLLPYLPATLDDILPVVIGVRDGSANRSRGMLPELLVDPRVGFIDLLPG